MLIILIIIDSRNIINKVPKLPKISNKILLRNKINRRIIKKSLNHQIKELFQHYINDLQIIKIIIEMYQTQEELLKMNYQ